MGCGWSCLFLFALFFLTSSVPPGLKSRAVPMWRSTGFIMEKFEVIDVIKGLRCGDCIHIEYEPFMGAIKSVDAVYQGLKWNVWGLQNDLYMVKGKDYSAFVDALYEKLTSCCSLMFSAQGSDRKKTCVVTRIESIRKI